jgi:hypothetical protein
MRLPGDVVDPTLVAARAGLLDALEALGPHAARVVLVGAQAVYLHTQDIRLGVALMTKDADVMLVPPVATIPEIESAMRSAGFESGAQPGIWLNEGRQVDLLVAERLAPGRGRRAAGLPGHGDRTARKVSGLEGAAVDNGPMTLRSLHSADNRAMVVLVAGPASLLVAKAFKLAERAQAGGSRLTDKDAFDSYRLLQLPTTSLVQGFRVMADAPEASSVAEQALATIGALFGSPTAVGSQMAGRYVEGVGDPLNVSAAAAALTSDLIAGIRAEGLW